MNNTPTILLVEDENQQREALTMLLEADGYQVQGMSSAEGALEELPRIQPALFISDVKLTGMDGFSFFNEVRNQHSYKNIPFIFISAYNDTNAIDLVKMNNQVDYITKPYNIEDFIAVVKKYLPSA